MTARLRWLAAAACAALAAPAVAQPPAPPAGADVVPTTVFAFVTVKVSDLWDSEALKPVRDAYAKEDSFIRGLEKEAGLGPADVERVTMFWPTVPLVPGADAPFLVMTTRKPYNEAKVLKALRAIPPGAAVGPGAGFRPAEAVPVPKVEFKKSVPEPKFPEPPGLGPEPPGLGPAPPLLPALPPVKKGGSPGLVGGADDPPGKKSDDAPDFGPDLFYLPGGELGTLYLLDDRNLLFMPVRRLEGPDPGLVALVGQLLRRKADGPLSDALDLAGKHTVVAATRVSQFDLVLRGMWGMGPREFPPEAVPFRSLMKARTATLTADLGPNAKVTARLVFPDAASARRAEPVLKTLFQLVGEHLAAARKAAAANEETAAVVTPLLDLAAKALDKAEVKADGPAVVAAVEAEIGPTVAKAVAAAPAAIQAQADRMKSLNNLKQILLACHNYHDTMGHFPTDLADPRTGKPILSWRVAILPYVEQLQLYQQFDLTKPWDDPQNKKLLERMPDVFKVVGRETKGKGLTYLQMPSSPAPLPGGSPIKVAGQKLRITSITDGSSNTVMVVEAADPVLWTKPDDVEFDPKNLPKLGAPGRDWFLGAMADGSVRTFRKDKWTGDALRALITINGGEIINVDDR
jgi:hypothetical protein